MGVYLTPVIRNKRGRNVYAFSTLKGSGGIINCGFTKEDSVFVRGKKLYYKTPVEKALRIVEPFYNELLTINVPLDDWSEKSKTTHLKDIAHFIKILKEYENQDHYLYLDESEYLGLYDNTNKTPEGTDGEGTRSYLTSVVKGYYNGEYLTSSQEEIQEKQKESLRLALKELEFIESVEGYWSTGSSEHIIFDPSLQDILHVMNMHITIPLLKEKTMDDPEFHKAIKMIQEKTSSLGIATVLLPTSPYKAEEWPSYYSFHEEDRCTNYGYSKNEHTNTFYVWSEQSSVESEIRQAINTFNGTILELTHQEQPVIINNRTLYITKVTYTSYATQTYDFYEQEYKIEELTINGMLRDVCAGVEFKRSLKRIWTYKEGEVTLYFYQFLESQPSLQNQ